MNGRIEGWATIPAGDGYTAPESAGICVRGICGKDSSGDDRFIRTSRVVEARGRIVKTQSGSTYELGEPDPEFLAHLKANGYPFDPENPIRKVSELTQLRDRTSN